MIQVSIFSDWRTSLDCVVDRGVSGRRSVAEYAPGKFARFVIFGICSLSETTGQTDSRGTTTLFFRGPRGTLMIQHKLQVIIPNIDPASSADRSEENCAPRRVFRQKWAFICLVIAWIIGTLVFELTASASETTATPRATSSTASNDAATFLPDRFIDRMQQQDLTSELIINDWNQLLRLATSAKLIARCNAVIASAQSKTTSQHTESKTESKTAGKTAGKTVSAKMTSTKKAVAKSASIKSASIKSASTGQTNTVSNVPDSMMVDPILAVMPVTKWITQIAYQQLDRHRSSVSIKTVCVQRLTLDQARTSALSGLMRLIVSSNRDTVVDPNARFVQRIEAETPLADSWMADDHASALQMVSATVAMEPSSNIDGLSSRLAPTFAELVVMSRSTTDPVASPDSMVRPHSIAIETMQPQTVQQQTVQEYGRRAATPELVSTLVTEMRTSSPSFIAATDRQPFIMPQSFAVEQLTEQAVASRQAVTAPQPNPAQQPDDLRQPTVSLPSDDLPVSGVNHSHMDVD